MRWASPLLVLGALACTDAEDLQLPALGDGANLLVVQSGGAYRVWAFERERPAPFSAAAPEAYFLVRYAEPLATLGFEPGEQPVSASGRALPEWSQVMRRSGEAPDWLLVDGVELRSLRLATKSDGECHLANECWVRTEGAGWCRRDCPAPGQVDAPIAPEAPALPDLGPCAAGWSELLVPFLDRTFRSCEPRALACAVDQEGWLGDEACAPELCPSWPAEPAELYVDPAAQTNGDGSQGRPFTQLAEALAAAGPGATIALAAGEHSASDLNLVQVNLHGACANRVRLRLPAGQSLALSGRSSLVGLTVSPAIVVGAGEHLIDRVTIQADGGTALRLEQEARLLGRRLRIRGAQVGVQQVSGVLELDQVEVQAMDLGVKLEGEATLRRARVQVPADGHAALESSGRMTLMESWIQGGQGGLRLLAATSTVQRCLVEDAIEAVQSYGGALVLDRLQVRRATAGGVTIRAQGDDDVDYGRPRAQVRDLYSHDSGAAGLAALGGDFEVARVAIYRAAGVGALIGDGAAEVQDFSVWATTPRVSGVDAGLAVGFSLAGGQLEASRVWLEDHAAYAFNAYSHGSPAPYQLILQDLVIRGVSRRSETGSLVTRGHGMIFSPEGDAQISRARIFGTAEAALRVEANTAISFEDLEAEACGYGLELLGAPSLRGTRVAITDPEVAAVLGGGSLGSRALFSQVWIRDRRSPPVASRGVWLQPAFDPGAVGLSDFRIEGLLGEGLVVEGNWAVDLERGAFINNEVGLVYPMAGPVPNETDVTYWSNRGAVLTR